MLNLVAWFNSDFSYILRLMVYFAQLRLPKYQLIVEGSKLRALAIINDR
jgi:hypothetical protein